MVWSCSISYRAVDTYLYIDVFIKYKLLKNIVHLSGYWSMILNPSKERIVQEYFSVFAYYTHD